MPHPPADSNAPINPYAAPEAPIGREPVVVSGDVAAAEAIRRAHLNHEANLKSVGQLHMLAALLVGAMLVAMVGRGTTGLTFRRVLPSTLPLGAFALVNGAVGYGLYKLQSWARWTEIVLLGLFLVLEAISFVFSFTKQGAPTVALLIGFTFVAAIPMAVLWLLVSRRGDVVFSQEYHEVIARTPHVRQSSGCALVLLLMIVVGVLLAILSSYSYLTFGATIREGPLIR